MKIVDQEPPKKLDKKKEQALKEKNKLKKAYYQSEECGFEESLKYINKDG